MAAPFVVYILRKIQIGVARMNAPMTRNPLTAADEQEEEGIKAAFWLSRICLRSAM